MNHIDGFFAKFKSAFASSANKKQAISTVCLELCKISVEPSQIEIQGNTIRLNISSAAKSVIFMKKAAILESLAQKIKPAPTNIV